MNDTTDSASPAQAVCQCGHSASDHNGVACMTGTCRCMKSREEVTLASRVAELEAAAGEYLRCIDYDRETVMHDNYTDRARNRTRMAEAERELRRVLGKGK